MNAELRAIPSGMSAPARDEIDLWLVFEHEARSDALLDDYRALLTDEERARESRFYFDEHQRQYVITRALVRTVLSSYCGLAPRAWRFATNEHGRPEIATPGILDTLSFNVAHTKGLIVCACTTAASVGIDAEYAGLDSAPVDIADRFFSPEEIRELHALSPAARGERFVHYWTLKESYIKATSKGLTTPLDQFSFRLARQGRIGLSFHRDLLDDEDHWSCWLLKPAPAHVVAVCAERNAPRPQRIVTRKVLPLVYEEPFECEVLAQSPI